MTISQEGKPNRINTFLKNRISSYPWRYTTLCKTAQRLSYVANITGILVSILLHGMKRSV